MSLANSRFEGPPATITTGPSSDDTRDRIINTYREEIKNHQARERDFKILQEVIADLQRKVRGLENEIGSCQRDHEDRIREQNKVINNLGGDLEQVKRSIQDNQAEGIQVFDQIQAVKRTIDDRNQEIAHTSADLEKVRLYNDSARRDIEQLHSDIAYQHDIKKKQQNGIYQLKGDQRGREKEVEE
jgi:chromosome segregation ATPase